MNKRQAKIEALSACAETLFGFRDSDFGYECSDEDREKLMKENNIKSEGYTRFLFGKLIFETCFTLYGSEIRKLQKEIKHLKKYRVKA